MQRDRHQSPKIDNARLAFRSAHFRAAEAELRALLERGSSAEAALLLARVHLRLGNSPDALALLAREARTFRGVQKGEAALLKGVAFARSGDMRSSREQFRFAAAALRSTDIELQAEVTYNIAAAQWMERQLERAEATLNRVPQNISANLDLHVRIVRGAIASANEDLPAQGAILLQALNRLRSKDDIEVYLYAMLVTHIAALSVELPSDELRDAALAHINNVPWTPDIADLHFHALRAIAWRHALDGDEFNAFRRLKEALAAAASDAWRVAALTDRAYLAGALGEARWAAQELRDAHELASRIDWNAVAGEEKLALPVLAQLFAPRDPALAISYANAFSNIDKNFPRILSSRQDRRVDALEAYSLGKVQMALGETKEAKRLLTHAWTIYEKLGICWRAARAAIDLARIDDEALWRRRAQEALQRYPRSWLARGDTPQILVALPQNDGVLTPAQAAVHELLMQGQSTTEIAERLKRSTFTVRNHIKAIFKAYGVNSRSALILRAKGG